MRIARIVAALLFIAALAQAGPFTYVAVYGDSLSDNGNLYSSVGYPPAPYFNGRMSNGLVAVENLANSLGAPLLDYAYIGATTGIGNVADGGTAYAPGLFGIPGMLPMFTASALALPNKSTALFVLWGGPNDLLSDLTGGSPNLLVDISNAVNNIAGMATQLQLMGATNILVPYMPDLGLTPRLQALGGLYPAGGSLVTDMFNTALAAALPKGVMTFDTAGFMRTVVANPGFFGFTDVTHACFDGATVCADPNSYLFWDDIHPTAMGHAFIGNAFAASIPEPSTYALAALGLGALAWARRRRAA